MEIVRAMTWNTWWRFGGNWRDREPGILSVIAAVEPDLLGIQECWGTDDYSQAQLIADRVGGYAAFVEVGLPPATEDEPDQVGVAMGLGLVSRWPIAAVEAPGMPSEGRLLRALVADIDHPLGRLRAVVGATSWEPDRQAETAAQIRELRGHLRPARLPGILLADLNYDVEFAALRDLDLVDGWDAAEPGSDPRTLSSTNRFAPPEAVDQFDRRIDHVLIEPGSLGGVPVSAVIVRDEPGGLPPSDHYPVIVDVGFDSPT
jgi:endonuclease/exonuclease/phosphatase family metal-dependent hydrolase